MYYLTSCSEKSTLNMYLPKAMDCSTESPQPAVVAVLAVQKHPGSQGVGTVPASSPHGAARIRQQVSTVASALSPGTAIMPSDRDGKELHSSTTLLYTRILPSGHPLERYTAHRTTTLSLWQDICYVDKWTSYKKQQPHASKWLHLHPILALAKQKIGFNILEVFLLWKG